jgi:CubicO group peptidase (beta-lactamase class C family)
MRRLCILGLVLPLVVTGPASAQERDTLPLQPAFRRVDTFIRQQMAEANTPGLALALVDRRGVIAVRTYGYADLERRLPVTPATKFEIGSISKSFTAIALLQLQAEGKFDPKRPVKSYLPWFTPPTRWRAVTGHDLLTHTAGLPGDGDDVPSSPAQAYRARLQPLGSAPGTRWAYSNIGYQVMGQVLEHLGDARYPDLIRARILEPLALTATAAEFTHATRPDLAHGYRTLYDDRPSRPEDPLVPAEWIEYGSGDGSIVATAGDLGRYLVMLLNEGRGPSGVVLGEAGFRQLMYPHAKTSRNGDHYGYGMFLGTLAEKAVFWHSGGMLGYTSYLIGLPSEGIGAVVFINGPGNPGASARFALQALSAAVRGTELPEVLAVERPEHVAHPESYAGVFASPDGDSLVLEGAGDSLLLVRGGRRALLSTHGEDEFLGPTPEFALFPIRFHRTGTTIDEATVGPRWYRRAEARVPAAPAAPHRWRAFEGHYRIMQPWEPNFRVVLRRGRLWWIGPEGNEEPLTPIGPAEFRVGEAGSAERIRFGDVVDGHALRATYSGMDYYRYFTP